MAYGQASFSVLLDVNIVLTYEIVESPQRDAIRMTSLRQNDHRGECGELTRSAYVSYYKEAYEIKPLTILIDYVLRLTR